MCGEMGGWRNGWVEKWVGGEMGVWSDGVCGEMVWKGELIKVGVALCAQLS